MKKITFGVGAALVALTTVPALLSAQHDSKEKMKMKNIVEIAVDAGNFTTLVTALKAADLVGALEGPGPFTVFAPSDAAFAKLPAGTVEGLLGDKAKLSSILTFHVVSGRVMAADIVKSKVSKPKTLNGETLNIAVRDGKVYVDGAQVVTADIVASNGVIHVIDKVLIPAAKPATAGR